jgi:hypothetical protein
MMLEKVPVITGELIDGKVQKFYPVDQAPSQVNCIEKHIFKKSQVKFCSFKLLDLNAVDLSTLRALCM